MKKKTFLPFLLAALIALIGSGLLTACQPKGDGSTGDDVDPTEPPPPPAAVYKIEEEFDSDNDGDLWNLGNDGMVSAQDGRLILTAPEGIQYPARGKNFTVNVAEYPCFVMKIDGLVGSGAGWGIKLQLGTDVTPARMVAPDSTESGLQFFDLTKVDGVGSTGNATFGLFIYVLGGGGKSIKIDYIRSIDIMPGTERFESGATFEAIDGTASVTNRTLVVESETDKTASVTVPLDSNFDYAKMIDVYISEVGAQSEWSLSAKGITLIDGNSSYGAVSADLGGKELSGAEKTEYVFHVKGRVCISEIKNSAYSLFYEQFDYENDQELLGVWEENGSAYIELTESGMKISKAGETVKTAAVSSTATVNLSAYPELKAKVSAISSDTKLTISVGGVKVKEVAAESEISVNLIDSYFYDIQTVLIEFKLEYTGSADPAPDIEAVVDYIEFVSNPAFSRDALAPAKIGVQNVGKLVETGDEAGNWSGNARTFSREGQLWMLQTYSAGYSKAVVSVKNIDVSVNRYFTIKIDEFIGGAQRYKVDSFYTRGVNNPVIAETNKTGIFTVDMYKLLNLTDETKVLDELTFEIFVVGSINSVMKLDYVYCDDTIRETPQIVNVRPAANATIFENDVIDVSAELKLGDERVEISVFDSSNANVTSSVMSGGKFSVSAVGTYKVVFSYDGADSVERQIEVLSVAVPLISSDLEAENEIAFNQDLPINAAVANGNPANLVYRVTLAETDVTAQVLNAANIFNADTTGEYTVTVSYPGAVDLVAEINVVTGWIPQDYGNNQNFAEDGALHFTYSGGTYWPVHDTKVKLTLDNTPYLKVTVSSVSQGATYKFVMGDLYPDTIVLETSDVKTHYIDIKDSGKNRSGYGNTHLELNVFFRLYIVGNAVEVVITEFEFLTEAEYQALQPNP